MLIKKDKVYKRYKWIFTCTREDNKHGCFSADFEGCCPYGWVTKSRKYTTVQAAEKAAARHSKVCSFARFPGETYIHAVSSRTGYIVRTKIEFEKE